MVSALLGAAILLTGPAPAAPLAQAPESSPRYRKVMANGVRVVVEKTPDLGQAVLVMAASRAGAASGAKVHGWAHLVEHLAALGPLRDVDSRLEAQGMTLTASNTRDAILFEIRATPEQALSAARILREIASSFTATAEEVAAEVQTISEEMALQSPASPLAAKAWQTVFGEEGLDPMGSLEAMKEATPESLTQLHRQIFTGRSLSVAAAGDLDPEITGLRLEEVFASLPPGPEFEAPLRSASFTPQIVPAAGTGSARASLTEGLDSTSGMATLGVAILMTLREPELSLSYSPSLWRGLIVVMGRSRTSFAAWDQMENSEREALHPSVQAILRSYFLGQRRSPGHLARFMAQVGLQNPTLTLDRLLELSRTVTPDQVASAAKSFTRSSAVIVEGSR